MNNRSQAVRVPKEFQFETREVFIIQKDFYGSLVAWPRDLED